MSDTASEPRSIAVIGGTGKEGRGIALRWARAGHRVVIGSRDAQRAADKAAELSALVQAAGRGQIRGDDNASAVASAEVALLSVPYAAHRATLEGLRDALRDRVVIDITVPLQPPAVRTVHLPEGSAAALEAQAILGPSVQVVAALHHVSSAHLADPGHAIDCDVLACSDHADALALAISLIGDLGLRAFDAGPLANAVALESLTPVLLHLNKRYKGRGAGLRLTGL